MTRGYSLEKDLRLSINNPRKLSTVLLNIIEFGRLSIEGLQCLLSSKKVTNDAYNSVIKHLPTLDQIEVEIEPIIDDQKVAKALEPLLACGSNLIIEDGGKVVQALINCKNHQSVRTKMILDNKSIFELDAIIEKRKYCAQQKF
ncbi:hypothetical protein C1646_776174 [Rhizophagus diaphanus]|nr:hypothetical protein C1646_776174 [Rhizophagus diaphanus] [Rhizophagus sp. MUCL 43196]